MGEKLRQEIRIPTWAMGLLITLFIAVATYSLTKTAEGATYKKQVEINTAAIDKKADKEVVEANERATSVVLQDIKGSLVRIESKLDSHIDKK